MRLFAAAHAAPDREVQFRQKRYFAPSASGHRHCLRFDPSLTPMFAPILHWVSSCDSAAWTLQMLLGR
jgi:hypothetical protein